MTRDQLAAEITRLTGLLQEWEEVTGPLQLQPESPLNSLFYGIHLIASQQLEAAAGGSGEWLEWFFWENDSGKSGLPAGYDDNMHPVTTALQIADLIIESSHRNGGIRPKQ